MKYRDIKQFPNIHYRINVSCNFMLEQLNDWTEKAYGSKLQLSPDFQRGHVWTEKQQIDYVEYLLKNPTTGKEIYFNHPNWMGSYDGDFVLVDGLQRITSVMKFLNNELKVYNNFKKDFTDRMPMHFELLFNIATLKTRKEVLQWYLDFNTGGTVHSKEEIKKVKQLLKEENNVKNK